ncbi:MAG: hypothetical protein Q9M92_16370 [Enterobacterales bacterium]|nr:hypothetical protein [Enterobacterales bacterium]
MFKRTITFYLSMLLSLLASSAYSAEKDSSAQDNTAQETSISASSEPQISNQGPSSRGNRIFFMSGLGVISDEQNLIDPTISNYRLAFQHDINDGWGIELGYVTGD